MKYFIILIFVASAMACEEGEYLSANGTCEPCLPNCRYCVKRYVCNGCYPGYAVEWTQYGCIKCEVPQCSVCYHDSLNACDTCVEGYYRKEPNECAPCDTIEGCARCNITSCVFCKEGYYMNETTRKCQSCLNLTNCNMCDKTIGCVECETGYYIDGYRCKPCQVGCAECVYGGCTSCVKGYFNSGQVGTCEACKSSCLSCTAKDKCTECPENTYSKEGECLDCSTLTNCLGCANGQCKSCAIGHYLASSNISCEACILGCRSCTSSMCTECYAGKFFDTSSSTCRECSSVPGCSACDHDGCIACSVGHSLETRQCVPCPSNCLTCSGGMCTECEPGYFTSGATCAKCLGECELCTSEGCYKCPTDYFITPSGLCEECTAENPCTTCDTGEWSDGVTCHQCPEDCNECSSDVNCRICSQGFLRLYGRCIECSTIENCKECDESSCLACSEGYFPLGTHCFGCAKANCTNCGTGELTCTECSAGNYLEYGYCHSCDEVKACDSCNETKCHKCSEGYYLREDDVTKLKDCVECGLNCKDCKDELHCTACNDGHFRAQTAYGVQCVACKYAQYCESCDSRGCFKCLPGYVLRGDSLLIGHCEECQLSDCLLCAQSGFTCELCAPGYYLKNGECLSCSGISHCAACDGYECARCNSSYYYDGGSCYKCDESCLECAGQKKCERCQTAFYISEGECVNCSENCDKCGDEGCLECSSNYAVNKTNECEELVEPTTKLIFDGCLTAPELEDVKVAFGRMYAEEGIEFTAGQTTTCTYVMVYAADSRQKVLKSIHEKVGEAFLNYHNMTIYSRNVFRRLLRVNDVQVFPPQIDWAVQRSLRLALMLFLVLIISS